MGPNTIKERNFDIWNESRCDSLLNVRTASLAEKNVGVPQGKTSIGCQ